MLLLRLIGYDALLGPCLVMRLEEQVREASKQVSCCLRSQKRWMFVSFISFLSLLMLAVVACVCGRQATNSICDEVLHFLISPRRSILSLPGIGDLCLLTLLLSMLMIKLT